MVMIYPQNSRKKASNNGRLKEHLTVITSGVRHAGLLEALLT